MRDSKNKEFHFHSYIKQIEDLKVRVWKSSKAGSILGLQMALKKFYGLEAVLQENLSARNAEDQIARAIRFLLDELDEPICSLEDQLKVSPAKKKIFDLPEIDPKKQDLLYQLCGRGDVLRVKEILKTGKVSLRLADDNGVTPLMLAIENKKRALIKCLAERADHASLQRSLLFAINLGAEPAMIKDLAHRLPSLDRALIHAVICGRKEMLVLLVSEEKGNRGLLDSYGNTLLMIAIQLGDADIVDWLLREGKQDLAQKNELGETAFMLAAERGDVGLALCLAKNKTVDVYAKNLEGQTAFEQLLHSGQAGVAQKIFGGLDCVVQWRGYKQANDSKNLYLAGFFADVRLGYDCHKLYSAGGRGFFAAGSVVINGASKDEGFGQASSTEVSSGSLNSSSI